MCCGRICMLCTCLILVVIAIGFLFGFGVFKEGFHKIQQSVHLECDPSSGCGGGGVVGRRGYGFPGSDLALHPNGSTSNPAAFQQHIPGVSNLMGQLFQM